MNGTPYQGLPSPACRGIPPTLAAWLAALAATATAGTDPPAEDAASLVKRLD